MSSPLTVFPSSLAVPPRLVPLTLEDAVHRPAEEVAEALSGSLKGVVAGLNFDNGVDYFNLLEAIARMREQDRDVPWTQAYDALRVDSLALAQNNHGSNCVGQGAYLRAGVPEWPVKALAAREEGIPVDLPHNHSGLGILVVEPDGRPCLLIGEPSWRVSEWVILREGQPMPIPAPNSRHVREWQTYLLKEGKASVDMKWVSGEQGPRAEYELVHWENPDASFVRPFTPFRSELRIRRTDGDGNVLAQVIAHLDSGEVTSFRKSRPVPLDDGFDEIFEQPPGEMRRRAELLRAHRPIVEELRANARRAHDAHRARAQTKS